MFVSSGGSGSGRSSSSSSFSVPYNNQTKLENSIVNQVFKEHQDYSSSFPELPDLFIEDDDLFLSNMFTQSQILMSQTAPQTQTKLTSVCNGGSIKATTRDLLLEKESKKKLNTRKRTGKKDRHSKICTSQGPRDRRMRLSVQIARKFFDLQDMLGFDKPSNTIEWLFSKSKSAVKELKESLPKVNLNCFNDGGTSVTVGEKDPHKKVITGSSRERKSRKIRTVPRESREKARARARERTREKHMVRDLEKPADPMFKIEEIMKSEAKEVTEIEDPPIEDASSSSSLIFIYSEKIGFSRDSESHEDVHGFVMNWDGTSTIP